MENRMVVTSDITWPRMVKVMTQICLRLAQYLENSWRCYLSTITNYSI